MNPRTVGAAILGAALAGSAAAASPIPSTTATTTYHRTQVDGVGIFYRKAGPKDSPTIVLLHGFPSSSRGYNILIPLLATRYHVVAPDFPGFGQSDTPSPAVYNYTFDHLAETIDALLEQLEITRYTLYLFGYGAPIDYRIILAHPERLHALIIQNGNAYKVGLGPKWAKIAEFWVDPAAHPEVVDSFLSYEATKQRHLAGTSHPEAYDPDSWTEEFTHLSQPGQRKIQAALLLRLPHERCILPRLAGVASRTQAADAGRLGRERSVLRRGGCDGLPRRPARRDEIARLILDFVARYPG